MDFRYKHRANIVFLPSKLCLCKCITDSKDNLASDIVLCSGVLSLFMLTEASLCNTRWHRIPEKRLDGYINSRVNFWVGKVQRFHQGLGNATFNQQLPLTPPSHFITPAGNLQHIGPQCVQNRRSVGSSRKESKRGVRDCRFNNIQASVTASCSKSA